MRCVSADTWKRIAACDAPAPKKASQFCNYGGKRYSIHSTRCEDGNRMRCVSADTWTRIAACKSK